jgi:hypothetical protein
VGRIIRILKNFSNAEEKNHDKILGFLFICVFPGLGIASSDSKCEDHPFDFLGVPTAYTLWILFAMAYILSKHYKERLSPLLLLIVSSLMIMGLIFCTVICIHFSPLNLIAIVPVLQVLFLSPLFCILYLLKELNSLSAFLRKAYAAKRTSGNSGSLSAFYKWLEKYNLGFALYILAPITALIQAGLYIAGQKPDSLISQFTDSCGFLLSYQQSCSCGGDHYLCSIAANGDKKLVKPIRMGLRQNAKILVNRQLLIANAFEHWLEEYTPRFHKLVRATYDSMNIPVNAWSKQKRFANILYILMKPLEWLFLAWLYLMDKNPETRIAKQYLPKEDLIQFINQHTYENNH